MYPKNYRKAFAAVVMIFSILLLWGTATVAGAITTPYSNDANTILLDHFDGATSASVLASIETGAACGSPKPPATPSWVYGAGPSGLSQALSLNPPVGQPAGSSTYLQYPGGQRLSQPNGTIEFWIYLTSYGPGLSLVQQGRFPGACDGWTFNMGVSATGQLLAGAWAAFNMNSGATTVPLNTWTHVAASWGSAGAKLYINGVQVGSDANTGMPASGYNGVVMVNYAAGAVSTQIDELRISNVQRTSFSASGGAGTGTHSASGTYAWNSATGVLTINTTSSNFICDGLSVGTENITGVAIATTTMTWSKNGVVDMTWTRSPAGAANDIIGVWTESDSDGSSWVLTVNSDGTFLLAAVIVQCSGNNDGAGTGTHNASGTYIWDSGTGTFTLNTITSDFTCEGPRLGTDTQTGVAITATTMTWAKDNMTWTRSSGTAGDIVGTWTSTDSTTGNLFTLTFNANGTVSVTGVIVQCSGGGGGQNPSASSQHWSSGYSVQFRYDDPNRTATAVSVRGPGITGSVALAYNTSYRSWDSWTSGNWVSFGATLPTGLPFTYTFSITDTTTWTATSTVSCFQPQFATNLSPTGSVTGTPTFSWTGIGDAGATYSVELHDNNGNNIWNNYNISGTSIVYNGPSLTSGMTYNYNVNVESSGACSSGVSFNPGSFIYGSGGGTVSFNGWVTTSPNWPDTINMAAVPGASVGAYSPGSTTPINAAIPDGSGAFNLTGIPASSNFFLRVGPPAGYQVVLSKIMNWNSNIQALLPFVLFTTAQYNALNTSGTGMILGRVALKSNPAAFLPGATVTATQLIDGMPTNTTYPVTYTSGAATTQADGIYMVKNVPAGALVQLAVTLAGYTFDNFSNSIVPTAADHVSEESFFGTPIGAGATISFSGMLKDTNDLPINGATVEQVGNAVVNTITNSTGNFTLPGLPSGTPFSIKMTGGAAYVPSYSGIIQETTDFTSPRPFDLFTPTELSGWGAASGTGAIRGRVMNNANLAAGYVSGATVTYTSLQGNTYRVKSEDVYGYLVDGVTTAKGRYYILDVVDGDTVTVSATHPNYPSFHSEPMQGHANAVTQGVISGTVVSGRVGIGGSVMNTASAGIKNATIEQIGATSPVNATTSNPDGSWYLSVPAGTNFQLKLSKPQASTALAPSYTGQMQFGSGYTDLGGYTLFPITKLGTGTGNWNVAVGKGIIVARVVDQTLTPLSGAIVTATSANHPAIPYAICYDDACSGLTATPADGRYIVRDVDDGDTVTVTATKGGYTFNSRIFPTHAGGVHQGRITGTAGTTLSLSANGQTFMSAGTGGVNVVAPTGFGWSAVSNASWIKIVSGSSGTGSGTVSYTVDANAGAARTGTITIGGQIFTITQTGVGSGFPVATTPGSEMGSSAAFDGTNYLVGIQGDAVSHNNITAQLVSPSGALVGSRISVGRTGGAPLVAFDGTNYLMIWFDDLVNTGKLYGAFINKSGAIVNAPFVMDAGPLSVKRDIGGIAFGGGQYLAVYYKTDATAGKDIVYGRLVSPAGVIGSEFRISTGHGSQAMNNVAFDGTNFFVVWCDNDTNKAVKGRIISPSGELLGNEITVKADNGYPNDNPLTVTFAGGKYLVAWTDQVSTTVPYNWDVFGQFVKPDGTLDGGKITISTAPGQQIGPTIAFNGANYLVSWTDLRNDANGNWVCEASEGTCMDIRGQLISASGALVGSEFIINNDPGNQMGGVGGLPVNGKLFGLVNSGVSLEMSGVGSGGVAGGDVYGMFMTAGEKIQMMNFTDSGVKGMNLYLYDPTTLSADTVVQNNQAGLANMNNEQTMLVYTKYLYPVQNNGNAYSPCVYNTVAKTTTCLATPTVEEDSAAFGSSGKILFIDKVDGVLKVMNPDGTNIVTVATPVSPYRFTYFSLSPDRQKLMIIEESRSADYYATNQSRPVLMNADGTNRMTVQNAVLGEWNMLLWKADSSRVFYYYSTFSGSEPNVVQTSHYAVFAVPGGTRTDLTSSALGSAEGNVCGFTKSGNLLSWTNHNLYDGQTGAFIATRTDAPTMMEAWLGFGKDGEIYFANLDGTNFRKFVESSIQTWTVTPSAVAGGTISPNTPQTVNNSATAQFTVTPDSGYTVAVTSTCGGSLNGTTYTTNPVTANCTVTATFTANIQPWKEDFLTSPLDSTTWQVVNGTGSYSLLTANPGYLHYNLTGQAYSGHSVGVNSSWSPSLALIRPFNGDNWVLNAKANYNIVWQGTGAQYQIFTVAFGAGNNAYLSITRGTDQWYNANILTAQFVVNGQVVAANNTMIAADDVVASSWLRHAYFYEIHRSGRCLILRYSADGTNYKTALSYQLPPALEAVQRVIIDANVYSTAGSYVDWDYIDFAPTPIPIYGDINKDSRVDLSDAILALQAITGMSPSGIRTDYATCGVDVNCDGKVGFAEVIYILQRAADIR